MNTIQQLNNNINENLDENSNEFDQLNKNIREGYNSLSKDIKFKKIKCKYVLHKMNVDEVWFSHILAGRKVIEGRLCKSKFKSMKSGDGLIINGRLKKNIVNVRHYNSFEEYLRNEGLDKCLPGVGTIEDGVKVYREFYTENDEQMYGVLAIEIM